jgi:hypothetical protein
MNSDFNIPDPRQKSPALIPLSGKWRCFSCREGLLTVPDTDIKIIHDLQADNANSLISTKLFDGRSRLLPNGITEDILLNEPPFTFTLDDSEIQELSNERDTASRIIAVAATFYGPPPPAQDKKSNEDYAISAIIKKTDGEEWAFAAVADGVSTKTFWAARTSRIACLISFKVFRQFIASGNNIFDDATLEHLQEMLVKNLREELKRDKLNLLEYKSVVPSNWSAELYENYKERDELWYNSTLLASCLGPQAGLIIYAGDGGIELVKVKKAAKAKSVDVDITEVLRSTEDLTIGSFVSLGVSSKDFRAARITYDDNIAGVEVILSSDGVDRTLQMNSTKVTYQHLKLDSSESADKQLHELITLPQCETDNLSVARVARYTDKIKKVPPSGSYVDKNRKNTTAIAPPGPKRYPEPLPPPAKRKIDRYIILPFIVGCCVGVGSALGVMYLRSSNRTPVNKAPITETPKRDTSPTSETENPADKVPPTVQNVNSLDNNKPPESDRENENKHSAEALKRAEARRAAAQQAAARRKQAEAKKPGAKPTATKPPDQKPTAKPLPPKAQTSPKPSE